MRVAGSSRHCERRTLPALPVGLRQGADVGARGLPFLKAGTGAGEALFIVAPGIRAELGHQRPSGAPRDDRAVLVE